MSAAEFSALTLLFAAATFTPGPNTTLSTALAANRGLRGALHFICAVPAGWVLLLLLCGAAFGYWLRAEGATWLWAGVAALAAYAAFWLLQCGFNAIYLISRNNRAVLREHGVTVSAEGLRDSTDVYEHLLRWPGVARVANYGWVVAVYSSAVDAVVLPRSAFASPAQAAQWVACVRAAARSGL